MTGRCNGYEQVMTGVVLLRCCVVAFGILEILVIGSQSI